MHNPTMSLILSTNNGSPDNLNVSICHGLRPTAFQIRVTVGCDMPRAGATPSVDQCVASFGFSVRVLTITASTCSSRTVCGAPERYSSAKPFNRSAMSRDRHLPTVACETPISVATAALVLPSAQPSTIRERNAKLCGLDGRRTQQAGVARSSSSSIRTALGRPVRAMRTSIVA